MEDAYCMIPDLSTAFPQVESNPQQAFFGIFDGNVGQITLIWRFSGHGGFEAAEFSSTRIVERFVNSCNFKMVLIINFEISRIL